MTPSAPRPVVSTELAVRVRYPNEPGRLAAILNLLRRAGGDVVAHLVYRVPGGSSCVLLCERPAAGALALRKEGLDVGTETVVTVRVPARRDTLSHLVTTLEEAGIEIGYGYAAAASEGALYVFGTIDNAKAEDVLRNFLERRVPYPAGPLEAPAASPPVSGTRPAGP